MRCRNCGKIPSQILTEGKNQMLSKGCTGLLQCVHEVDGARWDGNGMTQKGMQNQCVAVML